MNFKKSFILYLTFCLTSCATFKSGLVKDDKVKLTKEKLVTFNADFESFSHKYSVIKKEFNYPIRNTELIDALFRVYKNTIDSSVCDFYNVQFMSEDTLLLKCKALSDSTIYSYKIAGKLKRNGFFHLNNTFLKCHGVPLLAGGCDNEKTRVGISKDNELLVQTSIDGFGAILILFGSGISFNTIEYYKPKKSIE